MDKNEYKNQTSKSRGESTIMKIKRLMKAMVVLSVCAITAIGCSKKEPTVDDLLKENPTQDIINSNELDENSQTVENSIVDIIKQNPHLQVMIAEDMSISYIYNAKGEVIAESDSNAEFIRNDHKGIMIVNDKIVVSDETNPLDEARIANALFTTEKEENTSEDGKTLVNYKIEVKGEEEIRKLYNEVSTDFADKTIQQLNYDIKSIANEEDMSGKSLEDMDKTLTDAKDISLRFDIVVNDADENPIFVLVKTIVMADKGDTNPENALYITEYQIDGYYESVPFEFPEEWYGSAIESKKAEDVAEQFKAVIKKADLGVLKNIDRMNETMSDIKTAQVTFSDYLALTEDEQKEKLQESFADINLMGYGLDGSTGDLDTVKGVINSYKEEDFYEGVSLLSVVMYAGNENYWLMSMDGLTDTSEYAEAMKKALESDGTDTADETQTEVGNESAE